MACTRQGAKPTQCFSVLYLVSFWDIPRFIPFATFTTVFTTVPGIKSSQLSCNVVYGFADGPQTCAALLPGS